MAAMQLYSLLSGIFGTEYPKIYRKSVQYRFAVYLSRSSTDLRLILGHSVLRLITVMKIRSILNVQVLIAIVSRQICIL